MLDFFVGCVVKIKSEIVNYLSPDHEFKGPAVIIGIVDGNQRTIQFPSGDKLCLFTSSLELINLGRELSQEDFKELL